MQYYKHVKFDERDLFKDLLLSDSCKKKNGTLNLSEIARKMDRAVNTVKREINRFKNIQDYNPYEAQKDYKHKRKKCIKKLPTFTEEQKEFLNLRFNILYDSPAEIIQRFLIKFGIKFPACLKTFYKWIYLGLLGLLKKNLLNGGRRNRTKKRPDNRGKLDERFRSIWDIENKQSNVGWFEMDTVVGKEHQSSCLVLVERSSKKYFAMKLEEHTANEVLEKLEHIVRINGLVGKIKGIITDRGKEFSKFEEMEKIAGSNVYYCDPGSPKQKPLIERMNREFRKRYLKGTDFNNVTQQEIDLVVNIINEKLRPVLNWRTAKEVFLENFK
ncbi:IS30 family transposase [Spiroplasma endosymbiont of Megaselia nigra]|uniref:IS30 family transposase n=1 Tax=Spiroplasma endosymbiont of Megaselia nigra TaxID=2478537 RepID=UPI000F886274|nr:IS30 family transposase [Spiroplasma endosymbiont of Megaselia nigra]RUO85780.1 IS30 family transposase [Spiroplasma endosymbiont of Megaselia nigra]